MLYPLIFAVSSAMKDNAKIYEVPPQLLPDSANSLSLVIDYSGKDFGDEAQLKDAMLQDNILAMLGINYKLADQSIMEIQVYGTKDGKTLFYSRAHQMKLQMERDYGIYSRTTIKRDVLLHGDRYLRACESIGYEFDPDGITRTPPEGLADTFYQQVSATLAENYALNGTLAGAGSRTKNLLNLESFQYYLQMPAYIYPQSETIVKFGFMTFVMNSVIVIGFAMISQVILCSVCAFVISRLLTKKRGILYCSFLWEA